MKFTQSIVFSETMGMKISQIIARVYTLLHNMHMLAIFRMALAFIRAAYEVPTIYSTVNYVYGNNFTPNNFVVVFFGTCIQPLWLTFDFMLISCNFASLLNGPYCY